MKLRELLGGLPDVEFGADSDLDVGSLAYDSRRVETGTAFFAIQGEKVDGHEFVRQAIERGASAVVSERVAPQEHAPIWIRVPKIRRALSEASRRFYDRPDTRLGLVGITGTNGKTTTCYLLHSILTCAGLRPGLLGTIEYRVGTRALPARNTTPESLELASCLAEVVSSGGRAAVMEVSSHALDQERVWGFRFAAAVFTNLTQDHLDYHKDFEHYFAAKRRLFEGLGTPPPQLAVINRDDPWGARLLELPYPRLMTYGANSDAEVTVKHFRQSPSGLHATLATPERKIEIESRLVGRPNLSNILAAATTALGLGIKVEAIEEGVRKLESVPGRFERVDEGQPFLVVVDYAHTDDALRNLLKTAREVTRNRLIVVFGCGGDRDRAKRPLMGEAAGSLSDVAILTSDNPRSEDPIAIMNDAIVGLQKAAKPYAAEVDRETAIRRALREAREGDAVVIAGKGHETYQILKDRTVPFDDREAVRRVLQGMGFGKEARHRQ